MAWLPSTGALANSQVPLSGLDPFGMRGLTNPPSGSDRRSWLP
jgi:hypothetical protein